MDRRAYQRRLVVVRKREREGARLDPRSVEGSELLVHLAYAQRPGNYLPAGPALYNLGTYRTSRSERGQSAANQIEKRMNPP